MLQPFVQYLDGAVCTPDVIVIRSCKLYASSVVTQPLFLVSSNFLLRGLTLRPCSSLCRTLRMFGTVLRNEMIDVRRADGHVSPINPAIPHFQSKGTRSRDLGRRDEFHV
jgi:hypothetical protein